MDKSEISKCTRYFLGRWEHDRYQVPKVDENTDDAEQQNIEFMKAAIKK